MQWDIIYRVTEKSKQYLYPFTDNEEKSNSVSDIIFFSLRLVCIKCKENLQKKCLGAFTVERFSNGCFKL